MVARSTRSSTAVSPQAKTTAANVWDAGSLYLLIKKLPPRER